VHKTRVAARRARSVLRIFSAALLEQDEAGHLDEELSWYQDLLGEVRDRQVQRARFAEALSDLAPELVLGPVAATFEQALLSEQVVAREQVDAALRSERYLQLMATLTRWTDHPPVKPGVGADDLLAMAEKARRKARRRLKAALASEDPALLHRARKAAKRARYATELTRPAAGAKAKKQIKRYQRVQDVLGEHQDSRIAAGIAKRLGAADGPLRGHNGFSYGSLYAREQDAAAAARAKAYALRVPSG
jgi:CHAD domain-containing protein